jgi:hypothetical protein
MSFLELVECKFARMLTNWKTFLQTFFKNIIWHIFAGESHQVVKITVDFVHEAELFQQYANAVSLF